MKAIRLNPPAAAAVWLTAFRTSRIPRPTCCAVGTSRPCRTPKTTAAMAIARDGESGLALGTWGAVQATAAGGGIALGGGIRDAVSSLASNGVLGRALTGPSTGYSVVYHIEIALLFATLVAIGPLVRTARTSYSRSSSKFGLAEFPG